MPYTLIWNPRPEPQATHGCGDLIFSSHTTFMLVGLLTYTEYGTRTLMKVCPYPRWSTSLFLLLPCPVSAGR